MSEQPTRFCFALDLHDDADLISQYRQWHTPGAVPGAVIDMMKLQDIRGLDIYNCGDRLFMIMETGPRYDPVKAAQQDAQNADVQTWQTLMWRFQKPLPFASAGQKWVPMDHIFTLPIAT